MTGRPTSSTNANRRTQSRKVDPAAQPESPSLRLKVSEFPGPQGLAEMHVVDVRRAMRGIGIGSGNSTELYALMRQARGDEQRRGIQPGRGDGQSAPTRSAATPAGPVAGSGWLAGRLSKRITAGPASRVLAGSFPATTPALAGSFPAGRAALAGPPGPATISPPGQWTSHAARYTLAAGAATPALAVVDRRRGRRRSHGGSDQPGRARRQHVPSHGHPGAISNAPTCLRKPCPDHPAFPERPAGRAGT